MANAFRANHIFSVTAILISVMGIIVTSVVFAIKFSTPAVESTPTTIQPTSSPSNGYQPEIIPPPIELVNPTQTAAIVPTNTPIPTPTLIVIPTLISSSLLPDLTVTGLSDPICVPGYENTVLEFTFFVRNIGHAGTRNFGPFDVGVFFILGQRRYSLDEWDTQFDGVIGTSNMEISNLSPNGDTKFTVVIDLKGNKNFGIEVIANSGISPIREADTTNNTLIKYFSGYCY